MESGKNCHDYFPAGIRAPGTQGDAQPPRALPWAALPCTFGAKSRREGVGWLGANPLPQGNALGYPAVHLRCELPA